MAARTAGAENECNASEEQMKNQLASLTKVRELLLLTGEHFIDHASVC